MLNAANRTSITATTTTPTDNTMHPIPSNRVAGTNQQDVPVQAMPSMFVPAAQIGLESMPYDVKNMIFAHAASPVEYQDGLLALAKTSTTMRSGVKEFMNNNENGKQFSLLLKCGPPSLWRTRAQKIKKDAQIIRKDFSASAASVTNNVAMKLTGDMAYFALTRFNAVEVNLKKFDFDSEECGQIIQNICGQIASIRNKPVKINAGGFGGNQQMLEMILYTALSAIDVSCPVVLDLSSNNLEDADLLPLVDFIKTKPIIYQLNLDENPLCTGNQPPLALPQLFEIDTPLSHLYLRKTGFNDAAASACSVGLEKHPCLVAVDLRSNALTEAGALPLIEAVGSKKPDGSIHVNTTLHALRLQNNHFGSGKNLVVKVNLAQRLWENAMLAKTEFFDEVYSDVVQLKEIDIFSAGYFSRDFKKEYVAKAAAENQRL